MDTSDNIKEFSVSDLAGQVKRSIEAQFGMVRVRGELSQFRRQASGHWYGRLKDDRAVLELAMWKGVAAGLTFRPEDGLEVVATGKLTTYPGGSRYQLIIERLEPAGVGALLAMIEARRLKLAGEGLFDAARKRPLPFLPGVIGVVTSPTGAVIRDILHRLADRFPRRVLLWPVAVQGDAAAGQVAAAIAGFNALGPGGAIPRPDIIIVARGGGSIEDLAAFNEEIVVRAAAASAIPLISAVGHETDTTLIDYAADWRAPTPSAAAERAVPVRVDLVATVSGLASRQHAAIARHLARAQERRAALVARLPAPASLVAGPAQRLDDLAARLPLALAGHANRLAAASARITGALRPGLVSARLDAARARLAAASRQLDAALAGQAAQGRQQLAQRGAALRPFLLSNRLAQGRERLDKAGRLLASLGHHQVLARGYALVLDEAGAPVTSAAAARQHRRLTIQFKDGDTPVVPPPAQGSLF
ncbi:MAG: exodeoxyribonuclease VII large subunit [Sphingomonadales bacterium]